MISQTWLVPPDGVAPVIGDELWTPAGKTTVVSILESDGTRYLLRVEGEDPQPVC